MIKDIFVLDSMLEDGVLEEGALGDLRGHPDVVELSIAISLKRIADKLDDVTDYRFDEIAIRTRKGTL